VQAAHVATTFDFARDVPGFYYELAFHDVTQRPLCRLPGSATLHHFAEDGVQVHSDGDT
jgi:hypothetical protein